MSRDALTLAGFGRLAAGSGTMATGAPGAPAGDQPLTVVLGDDGFTYQFAGRPPGQAAYRDLSTIAVEAGTTLLVLGSDPSSPRLLCRAFGEHQGQLVREMRDRRLRQWLADRFVDLPPDEAIELVEVAELAGGAPEAWPPERAVAQLAYHERGLVLAPLDERRPRYAIPRGRISGVQLHADRGEVRVGWVGGPTIVMPGLGDAARRHADRIGRLRDAARGDAATIIHALIPDAPLALRDRAAALLVDGAPAGKAALGDAWAPLEAATLSEPTFAESYRTLVDAAGGAGAARWLALAPERPGSVEHRAWFFVALPGNLVAMELVSEGAHATYCFRVMPRVAYDGRPAAAMADEYESAVAAISAALVEIRFLREPIGLPGAALALPENTRYRLALAALPSLAAARARFVGRVVHDAGWSAAIDDLVRWHAACRADTATWPGRSVQEATIAGLDESAPRQGQEPRKLERPGQRQEPGQVPGPGPLPPGA